MYRCIFTVHDALARSSHFAWPRPSRGTPRSARRVVPTSTAHGLQVQVRAPVQRRVRHKEGTGFRLSRGTDRGARSPRARVVAALLGARRPPAVPVAVAVPPLPLVKQSKSKVAAQSGGHGSHGRCAEAGPSPTPPPNIFLRSELLGGTGGGIGGGGIGGGGGGAPQGGWQTAR